MSSFAEPARILEAPSKPPSRRDHLTPPQRAILLGLIEADPMASCEAIARRFKARAGRSLTRAAVRRAWVYGYRGAREGGGA